MLNIGQASCRVSVLIHLHISSRSLSKNRMDKTCCAVVDVVQVTHRPDLEAQTDMIAERTWMQA